MTQPLANDYGGLGGIIAEARSLEDTFRQQDRPDCPMCGLLLDVRSDGVVNCPMGHYRAPRLPKEIP